MALHTEQQKIYINRRTKTNKKSQLVKSGPQHRNNEQTKIKKIRKWKVARFQVVVIGGHGYY